MLDEKRMLRFTKMNGAGNDFVLMDNRAGDIHLNRSQIAHLCDRHRGIGADGILLLEKAANRADFRMRYFNADGGEAEMCGNGARCFARFANRVAGAEGKISFETPAGVISARLIGDLVTLKMTEPADLRLNIPLRIATKDKAIHFINSGVPHVVIPVSQVDDVDVHGPVAERRGQFLAVKVAELRDRMYLGTKMNSQSSRFSFILRYWRSIAASAE